MEQNEVNINPEGSLDLTAISIFYDANINPLRKTATKKAVECWMKQRSLPDEMMFIELGFDGKFTFSQKDFPEKIRYIRINGTDKNKYLFQKEHLWNIAAKMAKHEKLMFIDSDIAPLKDVDWFGKVSNALDKGLFSQGFSRLCYLNATGKSTSSRESCTLSYANTRRMYPSTGTRGVPGGVYCICKSTLNAIGGFNFLPLGGGDDLFWCEITGENNQLILLTAKRMDVRIVFNELMERLKKDRVVNVDVEVCHFYHGERNMRSYGQRQIMLMTQYPWMGRIMKDDEQGLLSWVDVNHYFYTVVQNLHTVCENSNVAAALLKGKVDYAPFYRKVCSTPKFKMREDALTFLKNAVSKYVKNETFPYDVIVSFTSYPERFLSDEFQKFLDGVTSQKCPGIRYHIVCTLWKEDVNQLTDVLKDYFKKHDIEIIESERDLKPHKKYIYAMQKYKDIPVITVDDDAVYRSDMVKSLYEDHLKNPDCIVFGRGRQIMFDSSKKKTLPYKSWKMVDSHEPSMDILPTGVGGVLYPSKFCRLVNPDIFKKIDELDLLLQDDFLLHYLAQQNGIKSKLVKCSPDVNIEFGLGTPIDVLARGKTSLRSMNMFGDSLNDKYTYLFTGNQTKTSCKLNQRKVVVTMTSWTKRIGNCYQVVKSILNNTVKPDVVYLNLSVEEFPKREQDLPRDLVQLAQQQQTFKINWVEGPNTKTMKKVFPILHLISDDDLILIVDDDLGLPNDFIEVRMKEFIDNGGNSAISGGTNVKWHVNQKMFDQFTYNTITASSIFQKRMLKGYDKVLCKELIETYNDDCLYTMLILANGFTIVPSKVLSTACGCTSRKIKFVRELHPMRSRYVKTNKVVELFIKRFQEVFKVSFKDVVMGKKQIQSQTKPQTKPQTSPDNSSTETFHNHDSIKPKNRIYRFVRLMNNSEYWFH